jgi:hypothetical protein
MLENLHMALWATESDPERLKIFLEFRKQPVAGSETTDQENTLHNVVHQLFILRNIMLTLTGVEAARFCCLKASMMASMDGLNKSATSWLCGKT